MGLNKETQEEFARQMQNEYQDSTILPDVSNRRHFSRQDKNLEFVQIGQRIPVPVNVFEQGILKPTTGPFARRVTSGEENFFLTDLVNAADDETIPSQKMNEFSIDAVKEAVNTLGKADTIFIPYADNYTSTVNDWLREGISLPGGTKIEVAGSKLNIRRVIPDFGIKDVLVTNSERIDIVQKQAKQTDPPKGLKVDKSLMHVNNDQDFMVYFAEDTEPGQPNDQYEKYLDVVFRTVISQPLPRERGAVRLEAPPSIELSGDDDQQ